MGKEVAREIEMSILPQGTELSPHLGIGVPFIF